MSVILIAAGCVSVRPGGESSPSAGSLPTMSAPSVGGAVNPSAPPAASLSPAPVPIPTALPSTAATVSPAASQTAARSPSASGPTASATPSIAASLAPGPSTLPTTGPSTGPSQSPALPSSAPGNTGTAPPVAGVTSLGANDSIFQDDFTDEGHWGTQESGATGTVTYVNDALQITVTSDSQGLWSYHQFPASEPVMRVEGTVVLSPGSGAAGYQCGSTNDDYLFGVVNGGNEWVIGHIHDNATTVLTRGPLASHVDTGQGGSAHIAVECAVTGGATDRIVLWVDDALVADVRDAPKVGPYDRASAFVTTDRAPFSASFDDVSVSVGDTYAPQGPETAVSELLRHVPSDIQDACIPQQPAAGSGTLAGVLCKPAGDADQAEYYQYDSAQTMTSAFRSILPDPSQTPGQSCETGPSVVAYTIDQQSAGQLACFPNPGSLGGILFMWTDTKLAILSFGVTIDGSYADLFDWWQGAGPVR